MASVNKALKQERPEAGVHESVVPWSLHHGRGVAAVLKLSGPGVKPWTRRR